MLLHLQQNTFLCKLLLCAARMKSVLVPVYVPCLYMYNLSEHVPVYVCACVCTVPVYVLNLSEHAAHRYVQCT